MNKLFLEVLYKLLNKAIAMCLVNVVLSASKAETAEWEQIVWVMADGIAFTHLMAVGNGGLTEVSQGTLVVSGG